MNQVAIAALMQQINPKHGIMPGEDQLRHMILNTIRLNLTKFPNMGDVILTIDSRRSWRKDVFPYYKADRGDVRKKLAPTIDWKAFYTFLDTLGEEISTHFPYMLVRSERAEGDDVIGKMVRHYYHEYPFEDIIIISGDGDFAQLHYDNRVKQYSSVKKAFVTSISAEHELIDIILHGDRIDGVPNILSPDNSFVAKIKQNKMTKGRKEKYWTLDPETIEDPVIRRNYYRNKVLTDLNMTPKDVQDSIMECYEQQKARPKTSMKIFNYLVKHRLSELQQYAEDFNK